MEEVSYKKQLFVFKIFFIFSRIMLFIPIFMVFYLDKGLSVREVMFLKSATFITVIIFEVPSGLMADSLKKKTILTFAVFAFSLSCLINTFATNFSIFLIASFMWGVGTAAISGADTSWLYNFMKKNNQEEEYAKTMGQFIFISQLMAGMGMIAGSYTYSINLNLPYFANSLLFIVALLFALRLGEDNIDNHEINKKSFSLTQYKEGIKKAALLIFHHSKVWLIILYGVSFTTGTIFLFDTYQIYLNEINLDVKVYGVFYLFFMPLTGYAAKKAYLLEKFVNDESKLLLYLIFIQGLSAIFLAFTGKTLVLILSVFALQQIIFGFMLVLINSSLNRYIDSSQRATLLSFLSLANNLVKSFAFPLGGYAIEKLGLAITYLGMGGLLFLIPFTIYLAYTVSARKANYLIEKRGSS